jgi:hypothetical protein
MKKTFYILALAAIAFSCAKEIETDKPVSTGEKVTIKVSLADETKVTMTEATDNKSMSLAWASGDVLSVNGETFTIIDGFTDHEAEFGGPAPSGGPYTIIYPGKYASIDAFNARSYVAQTQTGNSSTAHLEYNAALVGVNEYAAPKFDPAWATAQGGSLTQNAVVQMRLQLPSGVTTAQRVTLHASRDIFPTTNEGTVMTNEQSLLLNSVMLSPKNILEAYMMVSAAGVTIADGDELTVSVTTPNGVYYRKVTLSAQTWAGGRQYTLQLKVQTPNTFQITTAAQLEEFRNGVNSGDFLWQNMNVVLMNDIDCSGISSWTPIGNGTFTPVESGTVSAEWTEPAFKGVFDGQNHAINNLVMTGSPATYNPYGLFGILYGATVQNLTLGASSGDIGALNATPTERMDAGAVAGVAYGATLQNVTNYYPMTIPDNTSPNRISLGMVGYIYGDDASGKTSLSGLKNYGKVTATQSSANTENGAKSVQVAGIAGFSNSGSGSIINLISDCINYADIETATGRSAGILGAANTRTAIERSDNHGVIKNTSAGNVRVGGITVILGGNCTVSDCTNYGKVEATGSGSNVGGIVCLVNAETASVSGSTNNGYVEGTNYVGGIASRIYSGAISMCVNTGNITGAQYIGGIVGNEGNNNGWPIVNKCRSNATITSTSSSASTVGGIVGQMLGGVLHTCFVQGSVVAGGYDVGGIVGQMYCNNATYGRMYVYDCLAAADVSTSRTSGSANVGGVVGRVIRNASYTSQYMAVDNCIGLNQKISAGALPYVGAFVGQVTANKNTNYSYVRVRNCISLVEDSNLISTATANLGGFVGAMPYGLMAYDYYLVSENKQNIASTNTSVSNLIKSDAATLTSAAFCEEHSARAANYSLTVNSVNYKTSGWTKPSDCSYPVPVTLANLGSAYYK